MDLFKKKSAEVFGKSLKQTGSALAREPKQLRSESLRLRAASQKLAEAGREERRAQQDQAESQGNSCQERRRLTCLTPLSSPEGRAASIRYGSHFHLRYLSIPVSRDVFQSKAEVTGLSGCKRRPLQ